MCLEQQNTILSHVLWARLIHCWLQHYLLSLLQLFPATRYCILLWSDSHHRIGAPVQLHHLHVGHAPADLCTKGQQQHLQQGQSHRDTAPSPECLRNLGPALSDLGLRTSVPHWDGQLCLPGLLLHLQLPTGPDDLHTVLPETAGDSQGLGELAEMQKVSH